ncbi:MAG: polyribonucleotide nucleotidyltransferase, partial [Chloroflexota bacterium]
MSGPEGQSFSAQLGQSEISFQTGRLAQQAGGSVIVQVGDSMMLVTATAGSNARDIDFMPLTIEFEERTYAEGRIPGSRFRREGRPGEDAILAARLIDRPLRPLFNKAIRHEVQVIATAFSSDNEQWLDILAVNGASAALMISDIPWGGPIGAIRIGLVNDEFVLNPTISQMEESTLDLRVAGTQDAILMVEAGADEVPEETLLEALRLAHDGIQDVIALQLKMQAEVGKEKRDMVPEETDNGIRDLVEPWLEGKVVPILAAEGTKSEKGALRDALKEDLLAAFADNEELDPSEILKVFDTIYREELRRRILDDKIRPDNRAPDEIRPIWCDTSLLPRAHGSAVFTRGETQIMSVTSLGMPDEEQPMDSLWPHDAKRYMHHYNFPPYSVGETGRVGSPKRREIGHGALAERALIPVIPSLDDFPYALRVVSEALSSNGSTSMGSVCG